MRFFVGVALCVLCVLLCAPAPALAKGRESKKIVTIGGRKCELWRGFWPNGHKWYVHTWCGGKQHGLLINYNKQGVKVAAIRWRNGYRHGPFRRWHANGKLFAEGRYQRAHLIGRYATFYPSGTKQLVAHYDRNGALDGPYRTFHASGHPHIAGQLKHGVPDGKWTERDDRGAVVKRATLAAAKLTQLVPGPASSAAAVSGAYGAKDFALLMAWGGGLRGYDVLRIDAHGRAIMTFQTNQLRVNAGELRGSPRGEVYQRVRARRYTFYLDAAEQRALRQMLAHENAHALPTRFVDRNVYDGTQWHLKLRLGGVTHTVYCSNKFPAVMRRISRYLRTKVLAPRTFEKRIALPAPSRVSHDLALH